MIISLIKLISNLVEVAIFSALATWTYGMVFENGQFETSLFWKLYIALIILAIAVGFFMGLAKDESATRKNTFYWNSSYFGGRRKVVPQIAGEAPEGEIAEKIAAKKANSMTAGEAAKEFRWRD